MKKTGLPDDVHINLDLLRRITSYPRSKIIRTLGKLSSLGISVRLDNKYSEDNFHKQSEVVVLKLTNHSIDDDVYGNATLEAVAVIRVASDDYCAECALDSLMRLGFSQLSSVTFTREGQ